MTDKKCTYFRQLQTGCCNCSLLLFVARYFCCEASVGSKVSEQHCRNHSFRKVFFKERRFLKALSTLHNEYAYVCKFALNLHLRLL